MVGWMCGRSIRGELASPARRRAELAVYDHSEERAWRHLDSCGFLTYLHAGAARLVHLRWDEAWHVMDRPVARGLAAKAQVAPARIGVDEKSAGRGQDYITVVSDLDRGTVDYLVDERRQASLDSYFDRFTAEQRAGIEAVAMDMWEPYINSARANLE